MGSAASSEQTYFDDLVSWATDRLIGSEVLLASLTGERSDFVRFNHGDVRQAGSVVQTTLELDLIEGPRHTEGSVRLAREADVDRARILDLLSVLRRQRQMVAPDPYLLFNTEPVSSVHVRENETPPPEEALADIRRGAGSHDLVGIYAAGEAFHGFASSLGQRNWHQLATFNLDWSFYLRADKAAKNMYAGFSWDDTAFARKLDWSRRQLAVLDRDPITVEPGRYRTYLAPAAVLELFELWSWEAFGEKSHRTFQTPLVRMVTEGALLSPDVRVSEDTAAGVAPNFQEAGFMRPDEVVLIDGGAYRDTLVSPRSAREFELETNGASAWEAPASLALAPGGIPGGSSVEVLDTGLYVGNLWYTNFSDRQWCRTTGMTRFATFWAEQGELVAPVEVMRFDDTIYNLLGTSLIGLTDESEVILDPASYEQRSTDSFRMPGALVGEMAFTL